MAWASFSHVDILKIHSGGQYAAILKVGQEWAQQGIEDRRACLPVNDEVEGKADGEDDSEVVSQALGRSRASTD